MASAIQILLRKRQETGKTPAAQAARTLRLFQDEIPALYKEGGRVHFTISGSQMKKLDDGSWLMEIESIEPQLYETEKPETAPAVPPVRINPQPSPS